MEAESQRDFDKHLQENLQGTLFASFVRSLALFCLICKVCKVHSAVEDNTFLLKTIQISVQLMHSK